MKKNFYDLIRDDKKFYLNACMYYAHEEDEKVWLNLLFWAETQWELANHKDRYPFGRKTTARQKEVQHLWQQRGLLERTRANLASVTNLAAVSNMSFSAGILNKAWSLVNVLIEENQKQMATIKERIPE